MNLHIYKKILNPTKKRIDNIKTFWSDYNNKFIKKLLSYKSLRRENYFTWIGFFISVLISFVTIYFIQSSIKTYQHKTSNLINLSIKLEDLNPHFNPHQSIEDGSEDTESLNLEMEIVKIEKGSFGTREYLRPKNRVILSFNDLTSLLNFISSSSNHSFKNISIKKVKGSNDQFEADFTITKTKYKAF